MKKLIIVFSVMLISASSEKVFAHQERESAGMHTDSLMQEHHVKESVNAFPNYHPLVVHFPIVLLIMATVFHLLSFFYSQKSFFYSEKEFSATTLILLTLGVVSVWLASNTFHAHPEELTGRAKEIFQTHEQLARYTWWFSLIALLIKIPSHFFLKRKWWMESLVTAFLVASSITVAIAGHHGSMLVHMEGVGPLGKHLESHHNHDH